MKIKVCGIKDPNNLVSLSHLAIDMIGFNFYAKSKRFVAEDTFSKETLANVSPSIKKVGVFVNASLKELKEKQAQYGLDYLQLHGDEDVVFLEAAQAIAPVIKVFRISEDFDFSSTTPFEQADLFLFDTYTKDYGGSGQRFDWKKLNAYKGSTPFLLAGGIQESDSSRLINLEHPQLIAVDINSGFEIAPGLKNIKLINTFTEQLKPSK